jgi:uncharacterized protein
VELSHSFTVPADLDTTWSTFMDLQRVGGCFPGATVTEVTEDGFTGTVKVKLGPIALVYAGTGTFAERDDSAHHAVIQAKGKDKRGNGTAGATVTIQLTDAGGGSTRAEVLTDLAVTGKPAQFGRGVMQDVSDKLLGQFVDCIEAQLGPAAPKAPAAEAAVPEGTVPESAVPEGPAPALPHAKGDLAPPADATAHTSGPAPSPARVDSEPPSRDGETGALDLGSTVVPVLLKSYGKQVAAGLLALLAVVVVLRRRRRR